jgi:hypothetical protein
MKNILKRLLIVFVVTVILILFNIFYPILAIVYIFTDIDLTQKLEDFFNK